MTRCGVHMPLQYCLKAHVSALHIMTRCFLPGICSALLHLHSAVNMPLQDFEEGHFYALEKFWAFHQYSGLPKDSNLAINPKV